MERKKSKIVKFLEVDEIKKMEEPILDKAKEAINKNEMSATDIIAIRDFAVISLVYACALRISESCNLQLEDLDLEKKMLYVINGKGGDRIVPIPEPTIKTIKEWLLVRPKWKNNNYVFTNVKGTTRPEKKSGKARPIRREYYNKLIKKMAEQSGVKMRDGSFPHPHTLRHSRAMEIYDNVQNLEILQTILGHKSLTTTQIYAQVRNEKIIEAQNAITGGILSL